MQWGGGRNTILSRWSDVFSSKPHVKISTSYFKFLTRQLPSLVLWRLDKFLEEVIVMNSKRSSHFQGTISWRCEEKNPWDCCHINRYQMELVSLYLWVIWRGTKIATAGDQLLNAADGTGKALHDRISSQIRRGALKPRLPSSAEGTKHADLTLKTRLPRGAI